MFLYSLISDNAIIIILFILQKRIPAIQSHVNMEGFAVTLPINTSAAALIVTLGRTAIVSIWPNDSESDVGTLDTFVFFFLDNGSVTCKLFSSNKSNIDICNG